MTLQDVRDLYATNGFGAAETAIRSAFKVICQGERDLMNELWRLHQADVSAHCNEIVREHQEWLRDIKAGIA